MGCCGETARTRLEEWERAGDWSKLHMPLLTMLRKEHALHLETTIIDSTQVPAFGGGAETGPRPVDRRKKGTKYTLLVDRDGVPLVEQAAPANRSDHCTILPAVTAFPLVPGKPGRPLTHPKDTYGNAGFDSDPTRSILRWIGIEPHVRKRGEEHGSDFGKVRWVMGRTISWITDLRRMHVRYDRLGVIIDAWTSLTAAVVCLTILSEVTT